MSRMLMERNDVPGTSRSAVRAKHLTRTPPDRTERQATLAEQFRAACEMAGFSFSQIAAHMGVTEAVIRSIASGAKPLTMDRLHEMPVAVRREYLRLIGEADLDGEYAGAPVGTVSMRQVASVARSSGEFLVRLTDAANDSELSESERKALVEAGRQVLGGVRTTLLTFVGRRTGR